MLTGVESLQDTLRIFPPFQDDDGAVLSSVDINCPDCDAVFSTSYGYNLPSGQIVDVFQGRAATTLLNQILSRGGCCGLYDDTRSVRFLSSFGGEKLTAID